MPLLNANEITNTLKNFVTEIQKNYSNPTELFNNLSWQNNILNRNLEEADKKHKKKRVTFMWELWESFMIRKFPGVYTFMDTLTFLKLRKWDVWAAERQKKIEKAKTLMDLFGWMIPKKLLKNVTDPILDIPWFKKIIASRPGISEKLLKKVLGWNPIALFDVLGIMSQDINTIKAWVDSVIRRAKTNIKNTLNKNNREDDQENDLNKEEIETKIETEIETETGSEEQVQQPIM